MGDVHPSDSETRAGTLPQKGLGSETTHTQAQGGKHKAPRAGEGVGEGPSRAAEHPTQAGMVPGGGAPLPGKSLLPGSPRRVLQGREAHRSLTCGQA